MDNMTSSCALLVAEACSAPLAICRKSSIRSFSEEEEEEEDDALEVAIEGEALMDIAEEAAPLGVIGAMIGVTAF